MNISIAGASGNMMKGSLKLLFDLDNNIKIKILTRNPKAKCIKEWIKEYSSRLEVIVGSVSERSKIEELVKDADYLINAAAIIPPLSDRHPDESLQTNRNAQVTIADTIKYLNPDCALIHISTIATYGNRNYKHPWGRVGDPLMPSLFDYYGSDKLKGERYIVESGLKKWAVIRQTGILYANILMNNINDPLMFHTPLNVPIEWITDTDSAMLIRNIIKAEIDGTCPQFWNNIYSLGGGDAMRVTGFDTFQVGFSLMGGNAYSFIRPHWHTTRNFHCFWMYDSDELENMFHFQNDTFEGFFDRVLKEFPIIKLGKLVPKQLITLFVFKRLLRYQNSPMYWLKHNMSDKINAYYGDKEIARNLSREWDKYPLLVNNQNPDTGEALDYNALKNKKNAVLLSHGYDESKGEVTIDDVKNAADFRGLKVVDTHGITGEIEGDDLHTPLLMECLSTGDEFTLSPFGLLRAGYGSPYVTEGRAWKEELFNRYPFYNQVWIDSHTESERDRVYKSAV